jgi:hypothetical protein
MNPKIKVAAIVTAIAAVLYFLFKKRKEAMDVTKSFIGQLQLPRGIRNNNPGNLVKTALAWKGKIPHSENTDSRFEQFIEYRYGVRALLKDVINDINKGQNTITKLITEWAPAHENNTEAYIQFVANIVGINPGATLRTEKETLRKLAKAIVMKENGKAYELKDADFENAWKLL